MLDISDGLAGDAAHLAIASRVRVELELEAVPVAAGVAKEAQRLGLAPQQLAAAGGEDYELLVAMPAEFGSADAQAFQLATGLPLTRVGRVVQGEGVRSTLGGQPVQVRGYDHFR